KLDVWMPLYWGDYYRDTTHLSGTQHGFYLLLIGRYFTSGKPLPDNDAILSKIVRANNISHWRQHRPVIAEFFQVVDGVWRHKRIERELARAAARSAKGRKAANARHHGAAVTIGEKQVQQAGESIAKEPMSAKLQRGGKSILPADWQP